VNTPARLGVFAAIVAAVFGGAMVAGAAIGPIDPNADEGHNMEPPTTTWDAQTPRGLSVVSSGHRLALNQTVVASGAPTSFEFQIVDDAGSAVVNFEDLHERPLHLIVVSRNLVDYLHLHPTMDASGTWAADLPALSPGSYRVFAEFQSTDSANLTLGADVSVAGYTRPVELPAPSGVDTVDGYDVALSGQPAIGDSELTFTVSRNGEQVVTDPYLGAAGHLVAIREGDLAYLHVHPHESGGGAAVTFTGNFPSAGTFRLFFDFSHDDSVHTAAYTVVVDPTRGTADPEVHESGTTAAHDEGH
jgi:hypothetical protein